MPVPSLDARMPAETARALIALNERFYAEAGESFDRTRGRPWPGWERLLPHLPPSPAVLDAGCGNGRLGVFLAERLGATLAYTGVDADSALLERARQALTALPNVTLSLTRQDIVFEPLPVGPFDCVTAFGVLHHVPGYANRVALVQALADRVAPGGVLALAAWRFIEYERFRARIVPFPPGLQPEPGDYLLDWRAGVTAIRYCHAIDDDEFDALCAATGLRLIESYRADGFSGAVNAYRLLRR